MTLDVTEHIHLYWVVERPEDLYLQNLCRAWTDAFERFSFTPVIAGKDDSVDMLSRVLHTEITNIGGYQCYAAGTKTQLTTIKNALLAQGIDENNIFTETIS